MKKLFAVILALSMIAAMLPAGTALAADTETEKYEFKFGAAAIGQSASKNLNNSSGKVAYGLNDVTDGNAWKLVSLFGGAEGETVQAHINGFLRFQTSSKSSSAATNDVDENAFVFQIYLGEYDKTNPTPAQYGIYVPTVTRKDAYKAAFGGITDLYLVSSTAVKKNGWNVTSLEEVQKIINSAAKLGSGNESATADVIHLSSEDSCKESTLGIDKVAEKVYLIGDYYYLIATISKPTAWTQNSNTSTYSENEVFGHFSNITFTREADDTDLTSSFTAKEESHTATAKNVYAYKSTDTKNTIMTSEDVTTDTVTVSTTDTENFLYWAQGLRDEKKILSFEPSFDYTPSEGNNYLVAVYRDTSVNKAEFFNANGQREAVLLADGTAPALPERVGYEPATAWVDLDGNKVAPGEAVTVSSYNSYVPDYGERISVTVNGTPYNYGDPVTLDCNDDDYYEEGKYFKGWKKDNVIVSTSESYSFLAYKDTDVEAVWDDEPFNFSGNGRKIVLDLFNNALMAEFIGFENVLEKGIMFTDTTKTRNIAMTTDSSQFVIIPDEEGTYKGYAIVGNATDGYTLITDGEYTKAAE